MMVFWYRPNCLSPSIVFVEPIRMCYQFDFHVLLVIPSYYIIVIYSWHSRLNHINPQMCIVRDYIQTGVYTDANKYIIKHNNAYIYNTCVVPHYTWPLPASCMVYLKRLSVLGQWSFAAEMPQSWPRHQPCLTTRGYLKFQWFFSGLIISLLLMDIIDVAQSWYEIVWYDMRSPLSLILIVILHFFDSAAVRNSSRALAIDFYI